MPFVADLKRKLSPTEEERAAKKVKKVKKPPQHYPPSFFATPYGLTLLQVIERELPEDALRV